MGAFPADPSPEGTLVSGLTPPAASPVVGDLQFTTGVEHLLVGSWWDTWSHPYAAGDVYYNGDHDLLLLLPDGALAFYLYVQPNIKATFEFALDSGATVATLDVNGDSGASYVGFWTDDPFDPLSYVYVRQTTMDSDGFAVGEFGINVIPEPGSTAALASFGLLGLAVWRMARHQRRNTKDT
jgi:hypothetical protein